MIRITFALAVLAVAVRVFFWAYTDRVWEDSLITILHAENAMNGLGLTHYKVDEPRIHGFTSPLSVLIPLVGEMLHHGWGLVTMRLASLAAAFATVMLAGLIIRRAPGMQMPAGLAALALGYMAIEHHQILWGMAGMETQVVCAILFFSAWCYMKRDFVMLGVACALCVLVRPDFAIWTTIIAGFVAFECYERRSVRPLATTIGIALALYLPWIIFTTLYYGSPVPNTILAKAIGYGAYRPTGDTALAIIKNVFEDRLEDKVIVLLSPTFGGHGTGFVRLFGNGVLADLMLVPIIVSLVTAVRERRREILLLHGFLLAYTAYYVFVVTIIFGWYVVPYSAVAIVLAAHGLATMLRLVRDERLRSGLAWAAGVAYVGLFAYFLPLTFRTERDIQALIENPVRVAIGKYLHETPLETTIAGEPLGFIGFHSKRTYYDYPGLASRRVVQYLRHGRRDFLYLLRELQPHYLALREHEAGVLSNHPDLGAWLRSSYEPARLFSVPEEDRRRIFAIKKNIDVSFLLMKRKTPRPRIVEADELGPPFARVEPAIEGSWMPKGGFTGVPDAPQGAPWYGSWNGNDTNMGRIRFALPKIEGGREIGIPFLTGPMATGLSLKIVDAASGETLRELDWPPMRTDRWGVWRVKLPDDAGGRSLELVAEDKGTGWGMWLAVAAPHAIRQAP